MKFVLRRIGTGRDAWKKQPGPEVLRLGMVVAMDYARRAQGQRPDDWHWADQLLSDLGWYVAPVCSDPVVLSNIRRAGPVYLIP